jgi:sigma-E factor negative regulatory protein RseC
MKEELVEHGKVLASENGFVEVELLLNDNCEECSAKIFCSPNKESTKILKINSQNKYKIGDKVSVSISGKNILFATLNLYFYPLLIIIFTIFAGTKVLVNTDFPEIYSFLSALFFVIIYYTLFFQISKRANSVEPKIIIVEYK